MNVGAPSNGGGVSGYLYDMNNSAEVQVSISGGLGEADRGGPAFNIIPKTGGNNFSGMYFGSFSGQWGQTSNIDDHLRALGFGDAPALRQELGQQLCDRRTDHQNRIWFYGNMRTQGAHVDTGNLYANQNAGDPSQWRYLKDDNVRVRSAVSKMLYGGRITSQVTPRNKVGFYLDLTKNCSGSSYVKDSEPVPQPRRRLDGGRSRHRPRRLDDGTRVGDDLERAGADPAVHLELAIVEPLAARGGLLGALQQLGRREAGGGARRLHFGDRAVDQRRRADGQLHLSRLVQPAVAEPVASHLAGVGLATCPARTTSRSATQGGFQIVADHHDGRSAAQLHLQQRLAAPAAAACRPVARQRSHPLRRRVYAQDSWTRGRAHAAGRAALRHASSWSPAGENGIIADHQFGKALIFDRTDGVKGYRDLSPRVGAAYDLFGNGRTAMKMNFGRYVQAAYQGEAYTHQQSGDDAGHHRTGRGPTMAATAESRRSRRAVRFPEPGSERRVRTVVEPELGRHGADDPHQPGGARGLERAQSRLAVRLHVAAAARAQMAVDVSYNRRWWGNFFTTHNAALTAADFDQVTLTAPAESPASRWRRVSGPSWCATPGRPSGCPIRTTPRDQDFGDETHYWHGVDANFSARLRGSLFVQAGTSTGRGVNDTCEIETARFGRPMRIIDGQPACDFTEPWLTQLRGLASYTVPKIDVLLSTVFRSQPNAQPGTTTVATNGGSRVANFQMTPAQFQQYTGVPLRAGLAQQTVDLLSPGAVYGDRVNVLDMRIAKVVSLKGKRTTVGFDLYNLFNANTADGV